MEKKQPASDPQRTLKNPNLNESPAEGQRFEALDGLRGFAILAVLFSHLTVFSPVSAHNPLTSLAEFAGHGVDLFFALSGFLIFRHFVKQPLPPGWARKFWLHRAAKIIPVYASLLLFAHLVLPGLLHYTGFGNKHAAQMDIVHNWPWYAAFLSNFLNLHEGRFLNPALDVSWSLAVEVQFYLLAAFLGSRFRLSLDWRFWAGVLVASLLLRISLAGAEWNWIQIRLFTPARLDAFAAGILLSLLPHSLPRWIRVPGLLILICPIFLTWSQDSFWDKTFVYTLCALASCVLIDLCRNEEFSFPASIFKFRPLRWLGRISYSLYLTHVPVRAALRDFFLPDVRLFDSFSSWLMQLGFYIAAGSVCLMVGWATYLLIERPAQNLLLRLFDSNAHRTRKTALA